MVPIDDISSNGQMFPFDFICRSESARNALGSLKVRIWELRAWGYWMPDGLGYTRDPLEAEVFEFGHACEVAGAYAHPIELLFDPVNTLKPEPDDGGRNRWTALLKRLQRREGIQTRVPSS